MSSVRQLLPDDPSDRSMLAAFLALWAVSCVHVPYPKYFWLQHVPTVAVIVALVAADSRFHIGRLSYALILTFMTLHLLGARYLYSYVPYDYWLERLFGVNATERFGLTRNHYDRFVHFCFGLLLAVPSWRFSRRVIGVDAQWSAVFALMVILAASAAYEIFEWLAAVVMAPDWADSYNGQQGDLWDAQKDMALAACGTLLALAVTAPWWLPGSGRATVERRSP
jgi:putative membrane protein